MKTKFKLEKQKPRKFRKKATALPMCRLKQLRETQGISIVHLAEEAGVHRHSVARIENGSQEGNLSTHLKLIHALGVSADEYFGFISSKPVEDKPEILDSRKGFSVEHLPSTAGSVKRIQLPAGDAASLNKYLDPTKPVFFYLAQGQIKMQRNKEIWELATATALSFPRATNLSVKSLSNLAGVLLAVQP